MRVPVPLVILLCLAVVGGVWWSGTRQHDFLRPPSGEKLAMIRAKVGDSLPPADRSGAPAAEVSVPAAPEPTPSADPKVPPHAAQETFDLAAYREAALNDAASFGALARQLESRGELQKALLAWERILDTATVPDKGVTAEALAAVKRLRPGVPAWNADPASAISIILHAGTGESTAAILAPVLEGVAREMENASSGILKINTRISAGADITGAARRPPIALWLSGSGDHARDTEVIAFTSRSPETLRGDVLKTLFQLVRSVTGRSVSLKVPDVDSSVDNPVEPFHSHITRLVWREFGSWANNPPVD